MEETLTQNSAHPFFKLKNILDELRKKCPWDKVQTWQTLRPLTLEEVFELNDSLLAEDTPAVCEELGDILLHILFYAKIAAEQQQFTIENVLTNLCNKLISRHPHIYGTVQVANEAEVKQNWEQLKLKEGKKSVLAGVPDGMPSVLKAWRIQEKAAAIGFDWPNANGALEKIHEELSEIQVAINEQKTEHLEAEVGDLLFAAINYARLLNINPDTALEKTNKKFKQRFQWMETQSLEQGKTLKELTLSEMEELWQESKH